MASVNKVILIGNLGADPEVKSFQNGGKICNLRIATSESWKDKTSGERKERTEWHSVTISGDGLVGVAERYLKKGSKVYLEGKLQTRKWQDANGADRYSTEVVVGGIGGSLVMLDGAPAGDKPGYAGSSQSEWDSASRAAKGRSAPPAPTDDLDDDIPF